MGECMSNPNENRKREGKQVGKEVEKGQGKVKNASSNRNRDSDEVDGKDDRKRDLSTRSVEEYNDDLEDLPRLPDGPTNQTVNPV